MLGFARDSWLTLPGQKQGFTFAPLRLVPMVRIELATSPLPKECSTTELHGRYCVFRAPCCISSLSPYLERVKGIEPSS